MNIYDLTMEQLADYFLSIGETAAKARFVYEWLYKERATDFDAMINLKAELRERLKRDFDFGYITLLEKREDSSACKFLFELSDGNKIESVLMKHDYGNGLCISTQIGCNMGCVFCESGRLKKVRDLLPSEMLGQVLYVEKALGIRVTHITLMGIGEPFDNYNNVMSFIEIVQNQRGLDIGPRHITISTSGIVPKIHEFMERGCPNNLAVSLHAPDNEIRNRLMPVNKAYDIKLLTDTIREYSEKANKKVTLEYILLSGINDSDECALKLADLLKGINCYVNLIQYNETNNSGFKRSSHERLMSFFDVLKKSGTNATIRREFGSDLKAACGQLRADYGTIPD